MKLSTKGRYAVTAMLDLAIHEKKRPVTLADISQSQGISLSYLEQLFSRLRKSGLVRGVRGPGGGYHLAQGAAEITIAEVISAVDEKVDVTRCAGQENCLEGERCLTHDLWQELSQRIYDFLNTITLADLVRRNSVVEIAQHQDLVNDSLVKPKRSAA